ncbi:MAG TPA: AAA family ATPase [Terriglobia bacterium]|jgi:hypothetical protein
MSDRYTLEVPEFGITFIVDRLRRERNELIGELTVRCTLPGAKTVNGCLSTADFNFSSARARQDRAKLLQERARTNGKPDWYGLLEEFCQKVFEAEREGDPAVDLRTLPKPEPDDDIRVDGLTFPKRHPSILFGDGGAAKSYFALYVAACLARRGFNIAFFDWELCGEDHRGRLERFGPDMPLIHYVLCDRPLVTEVDRLQRIVRERKIDYAIFDSIAVACDGPPEAAEVAGKYFRAVRRIGCGSLHIAHVSKSSESSEDKPFGSAFWHNLARCTWFVKGADADQSSLRLGFYNKKANLGPIRPAVSFLVSFADQRTTFERVSISESPDLAGKLTIGQRLTEILKHGSKTVQDVASELEVKPDSIYKTVQRKDKQFILLEGGRIGLRG